MSDIELLSTSRHMDLRLGELDAIGRGAWHGFVEIVASEIIQAATRYPIFFAKSSETGRFMAGMLHGIQSEGQVRSYGAPDPDAYVPFALRREGFYAVEDNIGVDLDHPRLGRGSGRPLFEPDGQPAPALQEVQQAIAALKRGRDATSAFIQTLLDHRLVEPVGISLGFDDGDRLELDGLYTVSLDQVKQLDDAAAGALLRSDHLHLAYTIANSLRQLPLLARQRNRLIAAGA